MKLKVIEDPGGTKRATLEYEDLRRIAAAKKIPLKVLYDEVLRSFKITLKLSVLNASV